MCNNPPIKHSWKNSNMVQIKSKKRFKILLLKTISCFFYLFIFILYILYLLFNYRTIFSTRIYPPGLIFTLSFFFCTAVTLPLSLLLYYTHLEFQFGLSNLFLFLAFYPPPSFYLLTAFSFFSFFF